MPPFVSISDEMRWELRSRALFAVKLCYTEPSTIDPFAELAAIIVLSTADSAGLTAGAEGRQLRKERQLEIARA